MGEAIARKWAKKDVDDDVTYAGLMRCAGGAIRNWALKLCLVAAVYVCVCVCRRQHQHPNAHSAPPSLSVCVCVVDAKASILRIKPVRAEHSITIQSAHVDNASRN